MSNSDLYKTTAVVILSPADHANTAAATSGWVDVRSYEGELAFIQQTGVVTAGTIAGLIQHADDNSGTNAETLVSFTSVGTSTDLDVQKQTAPARATRGFVKYIGTIGTGPAIAGVTMLAKRATV